MKRLQTALVCLILFAAGVGLRLPGLNSYLTPDEKLWAGRTAQFAQALLQHDWAATTTSGHPGVTTTYAGTLGLLAKWLLARPADTPTFAGLVQALSANPTRLDLLPWLRLPIALICALGAVVIFLLARRLLGFGPALLAAGLLALDPFFLAHSRLLHLDALVTTFMTITWLSLLLATRTGRRGFYVASGVAAGLGVLTKSPALVLGPLMLGWVLLAGWRSRRSTAAILTDLLWLGVPALLCAWLLWPALWLNPVASAGRVLSLMTTYSQTEHELGNFWLGSPAGRPGLLFYPAVLLFRTTPVTLAGLLLALAAGGAWLAQRSRHATPQGETASRPAGAGIPAPLALAAYALWYLAVLAVGDKQFDRYLLPIFPAVDLLAAWGWFAAGRWAVRWLGGRMDWLRPQVAGLGAAVVLVGLQAAGTLANLPSYLTAYNPLAGGIAAARQVLLVGWGEGLADAANFLNAQPGSAGQHAAAWYGQNVFGPFYHGRSSDLYYDTRTPADLYAADVDYVVTYVSEVQRGLLDPGVQHQLGQPIYTSRAGGVALAQVYRWPKPFGHTTDRELAPGTRLLGWTVGGFDPASGQVPVTLFWDASGTAPAAGVHAWIKDAAGNAWATADAAPAPPGAPRMAAWAGRQAVAQPLALALPFGTPAGDYAVEMAVAGGQGATLDPVAIPAARQEPGWQARLGSLKPPAEAVTFDGSLGLQGYDVTRRGQQVTLDLLWSAGQTPVGPAKVFVHCVDTAGQIVAQYDGTLPVQATGEAPGQAPDQSGWQPGDLVRQQAPLDLPSADTACKLYVGLYRPDTSASGASRLSLTAGGTPIPDGRYELTGIPR